MNMAHRWACRSKPGWCAVLRATPYWTAQASTPARAPIATSRGPPDRSHVCAMPHAAPSEPTTAPATRKYCWLIPDWKSSSAAPIPATGPASTTQRTRSVRRSPSSRSRPAVVPARRENANATVAAASVDPATTVARSPVRIRTMPASGSRVRSLAEPPSSTTNPKASTSRARARSSRTTRWARARDSTTHTAAARPMPATRTGNGPPLARNSPTSRITSATHDHARDDPRHRRASRATAQARTTSPSCCRRGVEHDRARRRLRAERQRAGGQGQQRAHRTRPGAARQAPGRGRHGEREQRQEDDRRRAEQRDVERETGQVGEGRVPAVEQPWVAHRRPRDPGELLGPVVEHLAGECEVVGAVDEVPHPAAPHDRVRQGVVGVDGQERGAGRRDGRDPSRRWQRGRGRRAPGPPNRRNEQQQQDGRGEQQGQPGRAQVAAERAEQPRDDQREPAPERQVLHPGALVAAQEPPQHRAGEDLRGCHERQRARDVAGVPAVVVGDPQQGCRARRPGRRGRPRAELRVPRVESSPGEPRPCGSRPRPTARTPAAGR